MYIPFFSLSVETQAHALFLPAPLILHTNFYILTHKTNKHLSLPPLPPPLLPLTDPRTKNPGSRQTLCLMTRTNKQKNMNA